MRERAREMALSNRMSLKFGSAVADSKHDPDYSVSITK
jgi:hypothetical protein